MVLFIGFSVVVVALGLVIVYLSLVIKDQKADMKMIKEFATDVRTQLDVLHSEVDGVKTKKSIGGVLFNISAIDAIVDEGC